LVPLALARGRGGAPLRLPGHGGDVPQDVDLAKEALVVVCHGALALTKHARAPSEGSQPNGARVLWARGDDEAEAGLGTVVAGKGLLDLLAGDRLGLGRD